VALIYLIRHGQASFGQADYDVLSPTGLVQSTAAGAELARRGVTVDAAWSGTLSRQVDTAAACLAEVGSQLVASKDPRWNEYDHVALAQQHLRETAPSSTPTPREFQDLLDAALLAWLAGRLPGTFAQTWQEFAGGVHAALDDAFDALGQRGTGVVFTSGGVIAAVAAELLNLPPEGFLAVNRVSVNASISKVLRGRSGTSLLSLNDHGHFEGEARDLLTYR
jgi:broad specificity phosphatase PhoE